MIDDGETYIGLQVMPTSDGGYIVTTGFIPGDGSEVMILSEGSLDACLSYIKSSIAKSE